MKLSSMSERDRRALLIGGGVVLAALLVVRGIPMYHSAIADTRERLAAEREALSRERAAVTAARRNPQLQHIADSAMRAMAPRLFTGRDDVMASAELVTYLGDLARQSRVLLQDASTRPATTSQSGVRTLRVEIRAESDLRGVLTFLQALERGGKLVRVDRIDISKTVHGLNDAGMEALSVAASISGFALPGELAQGSNEASPRKVAALKQEAVR